MKTAEELNALKNEVESVNKKLEELSEEELQQVVGGIRINLNMTGVGALTNPNRNSSTLIASLQKLATGMEINSSADDSSGYQICERMR